MALKELEDYPWFPAILRKYQMEFIGIIVSKLKLYDVVVDILRKDLTRYKKSNIVDLCSGSGSPAMYVHENLNIHVLKTTLTDIYPQLTKTKAGVKYHQNSIDVNKIEISDQNYYTMYNAFHHFDDRDQKTLLQKIIDGNGHLLIVEIVQPTFLHVVMVTIASTFGVLLLCPFIMPFEWKRLVLTYILPVNLVTVLIDGYISILKSKSKSTYTQWVKNHFEHAGIITINEHFVFPTNILTIKVSGIQG